MASGALRARSRRECRVCGGDDGAFWWYCKAHLVWECDVCSFRGTGSHRHLCLSCVGVYVDVLGEAFAWCT